MQTVFNRQAHAWNSEGRCTSRLSRICVRQCVQHYDRKMLFALQGGPVSACAIAFMMAVAMTQAGPAGRILHMLLSARFWKPLADLSYSAYLYHEQVCCGMVQDVQTGLNSRTAIRMPSFLSYMCLFGQSCMAWCTPRGTIFSRLVHQRQ